MKEAPKCHACTATMALRKRKSDGKPFWGCSRYPDCTAGQSMNGKPFTGSKPVKKDQKQREAQNRAVAAMLAELATVQDGCECPFDGTPGPNNIRTAFGRIGGVLCVFEAVPVGDVDTEFREMFRC